MGSNGRQWPVVIMKVSSVNQGEEKCESHANSQIVRINASCSSIKGGATGSQPTSWSNAVEDVSSEPLAGSSSQLTEASIAATDNINGDDTFIDATDNINDGDDAFNEDDASIAATDNINDDGDAFNEDDTSSTTSSREATDDAASIGTCDSLKENFPDILARPTNMSAAEDSCSSLDSHPQGRAVKRKRRRVEWKTRDEGWKAVRKDDGFGGHVEGGVGTRDGNL